jgi:hypothetical protein
MPDLKTLLFLSPLLLSAIPAFFAWISKDHRKSMRFIIAAAFLLAVQFAVIVVSAMIDASPATHSRQ